MTEGNAIALLRHTHCRGCMAEPANFSACPDILEAAPPRHREDMFQLAMSDDFDNTGDKIIRLREHNWFKSPISCHPFVDTDSEIQFDPYTMPRCIEHDFSEGIIEFLIKEIFVSQCGSNDADRSRKCELLIEKLNWFPGCTPLCLRKFPKVSHEL